MQAAGLCRNILYQVCFVMLTGSSILIGKHLVAWPCRQKVSKLKMRTMLKLSSIITWLTGEGEPIRLAPLAAGSAAQAATAALAIEKPSFLSAGSVLGLACAGFEGSHVSRAAM